MTSAAEIRQLTAGTLIAACDGRDADIPMLLADADRDALIVAAAGLAIAVSAVMGELSEERRAALREQFGGWALDAAVRI